MSAPTINIPTTTIVGGKRTTLEILSSEIDRISSLLHAFTVDTLIATALSEQWTIYTSFTVGQSATPVGTVFAVFDTDADALAFYLRNASSSLLLGAIEGVDALSATVQSVIAARDATEGFRDAAVAAAAAAGTMTGPGILGRIADTTGAALKIDIGAGLEFAGGALRFAIGGPADATDFEDTAAYIWSPEDVAEAIDARVGGIVASGTFTNALAVNIPLPEAFRDAEIILEISAGSVSDFGIDAQFTRDSFSTLLSGASDYRWGLAGVFYGSLVHAGFASASDNKMRFQSNNPGTWGAGASPFLRFAIRVHDYADDTTIKRLSFDGSLLNPNGLLQRNYGDAIVTAADAVAAVNGLRIYPSSGNFTGRYRVIAR